MLSAAGNLSRLAHFQFQVPFLIKLDLFVVYRLMCTKCNKGEMWYEPFYVLQCKVFGCKVLDELPRKTHLLLNTNIFCMDCDD